MENFQLRVFPRELVLSSFKENQKMVLNVTLPRTLRPYSTPAFLSREVPSPSLWNRLSLWLQIWAVGPSYVILRTEFCEMKAQEIWVLFQKKYDWLGWRINYQANGLLVFSEIPSCVGNTYETWYSTPLHSAWRIFPSLLLFYPSFTTKCAKMFSGFFLG